MKTVSPQRSEAPPRIAPLAVLPVFLDLRQKTAIVAGGTEAAAWKAELLAAAGAKVHVYAPGGLSEAFRPILAGPYKAGFVIHERHWDAGCLEGAAIAVADAAGDAEAEAFRDAARNAGVPANVIDRPGCCAFTFGSIVNRSPLVVGISTAGAAPVLGQAVRSRFETLLPAAIADWAELAGRIRDRVGAALASPAARRRFWQRFAELAFGGAVACEDEHRLVNEIDRQVSAGSKGHVSIAIVGSDDPDLLTLKAMRAMQQADAILFDHTVPVAVLDFARREARRILVEYRGGASDCGASDPGALMVKLARAGKRVVRLTCGDGSHRLDAELAALRNKRIAAEIVPGVAPAVRRYPSAVPAPGGPQLPGAAKAAG